MADGRPRVLLVGLAYLAFVSLGLPDGLLGVAWPSMRSTFELRVDALGGLLVLFTAGYLASSLASGRILAMLGVGGLLTASCLATAVSLIGYALAPRWGMLLPLAVVSGLGAGAIDSGLNTYAATHFSTRSVNWLHACYGIGAATGPLVMTAILTGGRPWRWGYAIVGAWQCVLAAFFAGTNKLWSDGGAGRAGQHATHSYASTLRLPAVWLGIALFFFYTGLEQATGTWAYTLFTEARGISPATAGTSVSAYWGALTAGRILSGALASRVPADTMLRASMLGLVAGAALISLRAGAAGLLGLIVMGLSAAPIFPLLIAGTPARLGQAHAANAIGFQVGAAVLGQSVVPSSVGLLAARRGLEAIGPCLAAAAVLLLMLFSAARRRPPAVQ